MSAHVQLCLDRHRACSGPTKRQPHGGTGRGHDGRGAPRRPARLRAGLRLIRLALAVVGLLLCGTAAHPQPHEAPTASGTGREGLLSLTEVARIPGPHRAILRSTRAGGPARQFDWTAIAVGTTAGTARGVAVALAALDGSGHSLMLDADEVEPLLAYLEGAAAPSDGGANASLVLGYFQLRSGASLIGFPNVPAIRVLFRGFLSLGTGGGAPGDVGQIAGDGQVAEFRRALGAALAALPERGPE